MGPGLEACGDRAKDPTEAQREARRCTNAHASGSARACRRRLSGGDAHQKGRHAKFVDVTERMVEQETELVNVPSLPSGHVIIAERKELEAHPEAALGPSTEVIESANAPQRSFDTGSGTTDRSPNLGDLS